MFFPPLLVICEQETLEIGCENEVWYCPWKEGHMMIIVHFGLFSLSLWLFLALPFLCAPYCSTSKPPLESHFMSDWDNPTVSLSHKLSFFHPAEKAIL